MLKRALIVVLLAAAIPAAQTPAEAKSVQARIPWVGTNPYGFLIGDSIVQQCHEDFGMDWRSLGFIGGPGAGTTAMRQRLEADTEGWAFTTESSNAEERQWFRDAGWLAIGLGTNDVKELTPTEFAANIDWFMQQSRGRPVLWFTIHNPPYQQQTDALNAELGAAVYRWPNLRLLPWDAWTAQHPDALLSDQVHVATYEYGCELGRNRLIQFGAPAVDDQHAQPVGYWYPDGATTGPVHVNGWAAARLPTADSIVQVNVRVDYQHVGRWDVTGDSGDVWALAAGGRAFGIDLDASYRGHTVQVDVLDAAGQWTSLGDRTI